MSEPMKLSDFAALHGLKPHTAWSYARCGLILGAQQERTGSWVVYPPAKLLCAVRARKAPAPGQVTVEAPHVERRPRTKAALQPAVPSLQTGGLTYYTAPHVLASCRTIAAAAAALKKGGKP